MIIDPYKIVNDKNIILSPHSKIQQSGIDITIRKISKLKSGDVNIIIKEELEFPATLESNCSYDFECNEYVSVPKDSAAIIVVRSTYNRKGAFITTGLYDNGFKNYIGGILHTKLPIRISQNERIGQIVFLRSESIQLYNGQYQDRSNQGEI